MIEFLLSLILAFTGIARTVDPGLTTIAERRVIEVSTDATFSHAGMDPCCYEILVWNSGLSDPVSTAMDQWRGSEPHWAILTNPALTRIGCAHAIGQENRDVFACVLTTASQGGPEPVEVVSSPKPVPVGSTPTGPATIPTVVVLPNTAMGQEGIDGD